MSKYGPQFGPGPGPGYRSGDMPPGPPPPPPDLPGNDVEIIVVSKDQWGYAEMIERRLRDDSPIKFIDLLFLRSPRDISMTLNDLFERQTLYAIVISPQNEKHRSCTVHILHNQTEHRNIPIEEAIPMIRSDFLAFLSRGNGGPPPGIKDGNYGGAALTQPPGVPGAAYPARTGDVPLGPNQMSIPSASANNLSTAAVNEKRLPDDIAYLLRTILSEGGVQFLSLQQIDSVIGFLKCERDRLTSTSQQMGGSGTSVGSQSIAGYQSTGNNSMGSSSSVSALLENPQLKAALSSLMQLGAISNTPDNSGASAAGNMYSSHPGNLSSNAGKSYSQNVSNSSSTAYPNPPSYLSTSSSVPTTPASSHQGQGSKGKKNQPRRHPLMGTELPTSSNQGYSSSYDSRNSSQINRRYSSSNSRQF
ncbi:nuclear receptor coactivator protein neosin [Brevipalpus obovatus]|uniref:nuclear receptor coactivator protein neosin n=1 Tax=Brevipalpus obovatus TaxID=246614 RepID=UPI003D9F2487